MKWGGSAFVLLLVSADATELLSFAWCTEGEFDVLLIGLFPFSYEELP
jgi:hypothetical protein